MFTTDFDLMITAHGAQGSNPCSVDLTIPNKDARLLMPMALLRLEAAGESASVFSLDVFLL